MWLLALIGEAFSKKIFLKKLCWYRDLQWAVMQRISDYGMPSPQRTIYATATKAKGPSALPQPHPKA